MTRVLVVGSGAREHALAWKLAQSPGVESVYAAPGNPGTAAVAENISVCSEDVAGIVGAVEELDIDLTVVGPEAPLALGVVDALGAVNRRAVGPTARAARLESSKFFARSVMDRAGVPSPAWASFNEVDVALDHLRSADYPVVVKADGLAAGRGVVVCDHPGEAFDAARTMMVDGEHGLAGRRVVIEECLAGDEVSLMALVDGKRAVVLPVAQDHKRARDGDVGPNTGGMGAYAPVPFLSESDVQSLVSLTIEPVLEVMASLGSPYRGVLFAGLMLTADGPKVLEYNARLGDPEAQVILPLVADDLLPWLMDTAGGMLSQKIPVMDAAAVGVVLASDGYPGPYETGRPIAGLDNLPDGVTAFHAATAKDSEGCIKTAGGRVVTIVATGRDVREAATSAYAVPVRFDGMQRRGDIGYRILEGSALTPKNHGQARVPGIRPSPDGGAGRLPNGCMTEPAKSGTSSRRPSGFLKAPARPRVVVLASGGGSNLQALIDARACGVLDVDIAQVVSHRAGAASLDRARRAGIPAGYVPIADRRDPESRRRHEDELLRLVTSVEPDLLVLAGWFLVLSSEFLTTMSWPVINVHPALLPADGERLDVPVLRGAHAVRDALDMGLPFTGASVHHVVAEVDSGPVILRQSVEILPGDDRHTLHNRIKQVEHRLLVEAVRLTLTPSCVGGYECLSR